MAKVNIIQLTPSGGSAMDNMGASKNDTPSYTRLLPVIQLLGFVPLTSCSATECRTWNDDCYINRVFGTVSETLSTYENDISTFMVNNTLDWRSVPVLQEKNEGSGVWSDVANLSSTYGTFYNNGSIAGHGKYTGIRLNWGTVLALHGSGYYRVKFNLYAPNVGLIDCLISEQFYLMPFSCKAADRTVKFEIYTTGKVGSIDTDGYVFDLCNYTFFDSVRVPGFFGYETTQYDEIALEYQTGLIDPVRDEAIQKFKFFCRPMPKYLHDRLKSYGLMANKLLVSDYNYNNSDYAIRQKHVVKAGGYEPKYDKATRLSSVTVDFREGVQSVIKSTSCE